MFKLTKEDLIDGILGSWLSRPGLIDWHGMQAELLAAGVEMEKVALWRRAKRILAERPGVKRPEPTRLSSFWVR